MYKVYFYEQVDKLKIKREAMYKDATQALEDLSNIIVDLPDPRRCEFALFQLGRLPLLVQANIL